MNTIDHLTHELIDYAGLFPPASLGMEEAVRNFAEYKESDNNQMLGRFILPTWRFAEFEEESNKYNSSKWQLSVIIREDPINDFTLIKEFNARRNRIIDTVELRATSIEAIHKLNKLVPEELTPYYEIPIDDDPLELIRAIAGVGGRAKVRTGGIVPEAFPTSSNLARFLKICAYEDVPFKATAGLHHPLRGVYKLTYEPDSPSGLMHGFINVFVAAGFAYGGMKADQLIQVLEERDPKAFHFDSGSIIWRDRMIVRGQLRNTRNLFALSYGSCSFNEPIDDLKSLKLI